MSKQDQIDTLAHRHENLTDTVARLQERIRALELQADADDDAATVRWVRSDAIEDRLRKLEQRPPVTERVVNLEMHKQDQMGVNRRIAARVTALESAATTEQERAFLDAAARLRGSIPPVTRPSSWLMYELWRSAVPHPRGEPYQGRQAKLIERTVVPNPEDSYFFFPSTYLHLEGYPTGYHWLVKDKGETIVALAVNEAPPDPTKVKR